MRWLWEWLNPPLATPDEDRETNARREAQLRERLARLERMAIEGDVISRTERPEEPRH